ncbi:MAG: DUF305 domain-containing protein [Gemmatimonadaceae bacterium]
MTAAVWVTACAAARRAASPPSGAAAGDYTNAQAVAKARADSARHPYTSADVHFMSAMISHHAQALVMAAWAPTHGASGSVRTLAERIINAQQDEIATMQRWLADRRLPVPEARAAGMTMVMNGVAHDMLMPGMLTPDQMKRLDQARGAEFDRTFLTFMIQHHRGAVAMVTELFGTYGAAQDGTVFKFASDVSVDQSTEIARMETMLASFTPTAHAP